MEKPLIILTGPTAVGKTELSIALAKRINGEIISADSMQVYKYMDIGSAKITKEEMDGIPHYLIDEFEPENEFSVAVFKECAKKYIEQIHARGKVPIVVGGTGFYIQAVLRDVDFMTAKQDEDYRNELQKLADTKGAEFIHAMLKETDLVSYETIHPNNVKRVIRALEFFKVTGTKISEHNEEQKIQVSPYLHCYFVITDDRANLYERINRRVDKMMEDGLVEEVKRLAEKGYHKNMVSMQGLGYKEILQYLDHEISLEDAIELIKRDTRHFAKRQLTWFRREENVIWIDKKEYQYDNDKILAHMITVMHENGIDV